MPGDNAGTMVNGRMHHSYSSSSALNGAFDARVRASRARATHAD